MRKSAVLAAALACACRTLAVSAADVSAPAILQYFESRYGTIESRLPDVFAAGYGSIYTPPPGRADSGDFSVGYDQYDRFDLGRPGRPTLYGTETGLKTLVSNSHRAGLSYYVDYVMNHNGFSDQGTPGFYNAGGYPGFNITLPNDVDGDFHGAFESGDIKGRLAGLIDIAHEKNRQMIRSPVPGFANNIRAGTTPAFGRLANVPDENNRRFYPDRSLDPIRVFDPLTGEQNIAIYPFNNSNPLAGDPVPENATGYLMRNAQWLVQSVGVDGFRLDAAKHMEPWVLSFFDRAVYRSNPRKHLDGSTRQVFSFSEVFDGNSAYLQTFVRDDINPGDPGRIGGNRDVLDFPLFFALKANLSGNGLSNNWHNVKSATFDLHDDGAHNGSQGVMFVNSHDEFGPHLSNVAHAYVLMHPGNAVVYFNAKEFGNGRDFPKDGRGDALGGLHGNAITTLVDLRNRYGRGNFRERLVEKEIYAYERSNSAVVLLSNRLDAGFDSRTIQTDFAAGTPLIELTGNANSPTADPFDDIPGLVVVNNQGQINVRFLRNTAPGTGNFTGNGYLVYGLAAPSGALSLTNVAQTLQGGTPTAETNDTTRLADIHVIKSTSFQVNLNTTRAMLLGTHRDRPADGDNALLRIDDGLDLNNNGQVDHRNPASTSYAFEEFTTLKNPGYNSADGNGAYAQTIDASKLAEGMHFLTARAYRHRSDGGPAIYQDFKKTIYVDRKKPVSAVDSFEPWQGGTSADRDLFVRSTDQTADNVHILFDLPAATTESQILAMLGGSTQADRLDRDLFKRGRGNLARGNHVATVVTVEITGTYNVQRFPGLFVSSTIGKGLGDLNHDGIFAPNDVFGPGAFEQFLYSQNQQFNPAGDVDADGRIDNKDLFALRDTYQQGGASQATKNELEAAIRRRGDLTHDGLTNHADIDHLWNVLSQQIWENDLNSDGIVNPDDVTTLVQQVLQTNFGDADLNGQVDFADFQRLERGFGRSGNVSWQHGDFNGDDAVTFADFLVLRDQFGAPAPTQAGALDAFYSANAVPEPASLSTLACCALALAQRRRRA